MSLKQRAGHSSFLRKPLPAFSFNLRSLIGPQVIIAKRDIAWRPKFLQILGEPNTVNAAVQSNLLQGNTGGILVVVLPGLDQPETKHGGPSGKV
jgi:hypothetical protein